MTTNYRDPALLVPPEEEAISSSTSGEVSQVVPRVLSSPSSQYFVQSVLGVGGFGNVTKCLKAATREMVAVKILQKNNNIAPQVQNEVAILEQLRAFNSDSFNFVRYNNGFIDREYICLEFEMLDINLWDYMQTRPSRSLSMKEIRPVLHQMATALQFLKNIEIVHTDIKPDNIMMVDHVNQPMKIKLIDFGLACHVSVSKWGTYTRALPYRAPENILGFPVTPALDMWALGCVAAELFTGNLLYPANSEYAMIRYMVQTQGQLPQQVLEDGINTKFWFVQSSSQNQWRLKTFDEYGDTSWTKTCINSLDDLTKVKLVCHLSDEDTMAEIKDRENFVDLLKKMLHLDVDKRITPSHLLEDPFITMNDLAVSYPNSFYVKSCCELMEVCQNQSQSHQDLLACHSRQEHPIILELTSAFSSSLNISMEASSYRDRLKPRKKRLRSTSPLSVKGSFGPSNSPENTQPDRKRKRMDMDFFTHDSKKAPTKAPSSTAERKPQRKRKWDVFIGSHISLRNIPDSGSEPERKRMKMSLETLCDSRQASSSKASSSKASSSKANPSDRDCRTAPLGGGRGKGMRKSEPG